MYEILLFINILKLKIIIKLESTACKTELSTVTKQFEIEPIWFSKFHFGNQVEYNISKGLSM